MARARERGNARPAILSAAARIVGRDGVSNLTLDAVAAEAGVSKGGLLYHFRTKESLIVGMIDVFLQGFTASVERRVLEEQHRGASPVGAWTRAFIRSSFDETLALAPDVPASPEHSAGLLAAIATDPALLKPIHEAMQQWQQRIESDGIDPALATVVRLACDGLAFADLFGGSLPSGELRRAVRDTLMTLVNEATRNGVAPDRRE